MSQEDLAENYKKIKADIQELITKEMEKIRPIVEEKEKLATLVTDETTKSNSRNNSKVSSVLKKSKKPLKKSLSL